VEKFCSRREVVLLFASECHGFHVLCYAQRTRRNLLHCIYIQIYLSSENVFSIYLLFAAIPQSDELRFFPDYSDEMIENFYKRSHVIICPIQFPNQSVSQDEAAGGEKKGEPFFTYRDCRPCCNVYILSSLAGPMAYVSIFPCFWQDT